MKIGMVKQAAEFTGPFCWKCHDPFKQGLDEGVTCEFCHGKTGETGCDQDDESLHIEVRKMGLKSLRDEKWCHQCHSITQPITGVDLQGTVHEWEQSKTRKISFNIDKSIKISKMTATLRCGFVGDHGEKLEAWTSDYIARKEIAF